MPSKSEEQQFREGDRVVLARVHHAHNSGLKKNEGRGGEVQKQHHTGSDKYLVCFDGQTSDPMNRWWVHANYLEPEEDDG